MNPIVSELLLRYLELGLLLPVGYATWRLLLLTLPRDGVTSASRARLGQVLLVLTLVAPAVAAVLPGLPSGTLGWGATEVATTAAPAGMAADDGGREGGFTLLGWAAAASWSGPAWRMTRQISLACQ